MMDELSFVESIDLTSWCCMVQSSYFNWFRQNLFFTGSNEWIPWSFSFHSMVLH